MSVLFIGDLSVEFKTPWGRVRALRSVYLTVAQGRIMGIVGESGCGKSTLAYAVIGLLAENSEVTGGVIDFEGKDLLKLPEGELRKLRGNRISMVFQDPMTSLNPVLSIGAQMTDIQYRENIGKTEKRRHAVEMLSRVGIPDALRQMRNYPHQFSGGMRQRIAIAMALLARPALLIADEPTTALDATLEAQIVHLLRDLQAELGCSILFISHYLGLVAEFCDDVMVMYAGEVVEEGTVRDIFHRPAHPYTKALLECDPARIARSEKKLPTIPGDIPDLIDLPNGCIFVNRCHQASDRCLEERPVRRMVSNGHFVSCLPEGGGEAR